MRLNDVRNVVNRTTLQVNTCLIFYRLNMTPLLNYVIATLRAVFAFARLNLYRPIIIYIDPTSKHIECLSRKCKILNSPIYLLPNVEVSLSGNAPVTHIDVVCIASGPGCKAAWCKFYWVVLPMFVES